MPVPTIDASGIFDSSIALANKWLTPFNNIKTFLTDLTAGNASVPVERLLWGTQSAAIAGTTLSAITKKYVIVDTDGSAAQNLATITGPVQGHEVVLEMANAGRVVTVKHGTGNIFLWGGQDVVLAVGKVLHLFRTSTGWSDVFIPVTSLASQVCNVRLTLTSGTAVTTSDVTAATNVYVTPFRGNRIALYNGSTWVTYTLSEITISLTGLAADKNYDVFVYDNGSGTVIAESVVWTGDTTRATALALQDGVYVKSGTVTKRYIGTYRTTSTIGQCEDSVTKRYVWNYYNRIERDFYLIEATNSWTYATATWRAWNSSTSNRFSFVRGVNEEPVSVNFIPNASEAGAVAASAGIGLDWTSGAPGVTSINGQLISTTATAMPAIYIGKPSEGFHYLQFVEFASGATVTFYGDNGGTQMQSGATGKLAG